MAWIAKKYIFRWWMGKKFIYWW